MSQDFHSSKSVNLYFSLTLRTYVLLVVLVSDLLASLWSKLKRHSDMTNLQFTIIIKKTFAAFAPLTNVMLDRVAFTVVVI